MLISMVLGMNPNLEMFLARIRQTIYENPDKPLLAVNRYIEAASKYREVLSRINKRLNAPRGREGFYPSSYTEEAVDNPRVAGRKDGIVEQILKTPNLEALDWLIKEKNYQFTTTDFFHAIASGKKEVFNQVFEQVQKNGLRFEWNRKKYEFRDATQATHNLDHSLLGFIRLAHAVNNENAQRKLLDPDRNTIEIFRGHRSDKI